MTAQKARPAFLTVLCILSWVGSGMVILGQLAGLAMKDFSKAAMGQYESMSDEIPMSDFSWYESMMGQSMRQLENIWEIFFIKVTAALIVLFAAIMMWKLKKSGYFLFLGGKAVVLIGLAVVMGATSGMFIGALIVAIAFSIMYGLNLKAMR